MIPGAILTILRGLPWKWIAAGAAVLGAIWFVHHRGYASGVASQQPTIVSLNATIANVRTATAKAQADDLAHKRAVETQDAKIAQEKTDALEKQLADARAAVADYVRMHAAPAADSSGSRTAAVSFTPAAASASAGAGSQALVPVSDLSICADNSVKAQGWIDWWKAVVEAAR